MSPHVDLSIEVDVNGPISWFESEGRDLPWRRTRDPWSILVSELMLQQTQAARVVDRLPQFLDQFPTPSACAAATAGEVITEWSGLGYNRRAVSLHRSSRIMVAEHGGAVPSNMASLLALPGVGPYTARAVRVFAFEQLEAVVDTNIGRILARIVGSRLTPRNAQLLADSLVPTDRPWLWNQSIMELGALICRPKPACAECPLSSSCAWFKSGLAEPDPAMRSAQVSTGQSKFEGSDRQGRGALLRALQSGPVSADQVAAALGWPDDVARAERVLDTMVDDGLVELGADGCVALP